MDLILLQPGDGAIFGGADNGRNGGGVRLDDRWPVEIAESGPCIELMSVHHGMGQQITTDISNSVRTSGRPKLSEFTCVKYVDQASVRLYDCCLRAKPLGTGEMQATRIHLLRTSGDNATSMMTITLRDAIVSEIEFQADADGVPTEQFKLNFTELLWAYTVRQADEQTLGVSAGWSVARNRPIQRFT